MTAAEFLKKRNIIPKNAKDILLGFDNNTQESLIEILDSYKNESLKSCMYCEKKLKINEAIILCKACTK